MYNRCMSQHRDLQKGSIPTLVLAVLSDAPRHGYAIAREIERRSRNALKAGEGSLYPALHALEGDGFIAGTWETQPSGPARKIYSLTDAGRSDLAKRAKAWKDYTSAVGLVLEGA